MSSMFIERILYNILNSRIEYYKNNLLQLEEFFFAGLQDADEAAKARAYFAEKPPRVIHGFPRVDGTFPCYAITLGSEDIARDYIGEDAFNTDENDDIYLDGDGDAQDVHVREWNHLFNVITYVDHPDICLYYYQLAKSIYTSARQVFIQNDLTNVRFNGSDLGPEARFTPEFLFMRRLGITLESDWIYSDEQGFPVSYTLQGISVDDGEPLSSGLTAEQQSEMKALVTNVTTYNDGEE